MLEQYVKKILTSPVYDVAVETPLQPARSLSERLNNQILLKREDLQPVFSFKIRGAYNKAALTQRGGEGARRGHRLGRQPRPGPGPGGEEAGREGGHRHAQDHPGA